MTREEAVAILKGADSPGFVSFGSGGTVQLDGHFSAREVEAVLVLMRAPDRLSDKAREVQP